MKIPRNGGSFFSRVLLLSGVPAFGLRDSPGSRIFKRTVIPAGARAVVGGTDFRFLTRPFRGSSFFAGKRARRAGIQALASFRKRGEAECSGAELLESRRSFPSHRRSGVGSKFGRLDSGSTLHFPVKKFPEATESTCFIDTRGAYRCARNDDCRDESL